jgi:hypothetical protein
MKLKDLIDTISLEQLKDSLSSYSKEELTEAFLQTDDIDKNMLLFDQTIEIDDSDYQFFAMQLFLKNVAQDNARFFIYGKKENAYLTSSIFQNGASPEVVEENYRFLEKLGIHNFAQEFLEELIVDAPIVYIQDFLAKHHVSDFNLEELTKMDSKQICSHFKLHRHYTCLSNAINEHGYEILEIMLNMGLKVKPKDYTLIEASLLKEDFKVLDKLLALGVKMPTEKKLENLMCFLCIQGLNQSIDYLVKNQLVDFKKAKKTLGTNIYIDNFLKGERTGWNKNAVATMKLFVSYGMDIFSSQKIIFNSLSKPKYQFNQELVDYLINLGFDKIGKNFDSTSFPSRYIFDKISIIHEKKYIETIFQEKVEDKKRFKM